MCKIFGLTSTASLDAPKLTALVQRAHHHLTATQRDGWGFALHHPETGRYAEKWDKPQAWPGAFAWPALAESLAGIPVDVDCEITGTAPPAGGGPLIAHARTSTCSPGAANAHPHTVGEWTIVHNGVVEPIKGKVKPCDSVHIADSLNKHNGASGLASDVAGYLAILGINPAGHLVALRDTRAPLVVAFVPLLKAWAFASTPDLLKSIVDAPHQKPLDLLPYKFVAFDGRKWGHNGVKAWDAAAPRVSAKASRAFGDDDAFPSWENKYWKDKYNKK